MDGSFDLNILEHQLAGDPRWIEVKGRIRLLRTLNAAVIDFQHVRANLDFLVSFWENPTLATALMQHSILLYARATANGNDGLSRWKFKPALKRKAHREWHEEMHELRNKWVAHYGSFYPETVDPMMDDRIVAVFELGGTVSVWGPWTRLASMSAVSIRLGQLTDLLGHFSNGERERVARELALRIVGDTELLEVLKLRRGDLRFEPLNFFRTKVRLGEWPPVNEQPFARVQINSV